MGYDRFGYPTPTPRKRVREVLSTGAAVAVCIIITAFLALCVWLGGREPEREPEQGPTIRHDSLAPTYTYDGEIIRWYVLVDPDTQIEYLVNDRGGCTPRLTKCGKVMRLEVGQ